MALITRSLFESLAPLCTTLSFSGLGYAPFLAAIRAEVEGVRKNIFLKLYTKIVPSSAKAKTVQVWLAKKSYCHYCGKRRHFTREFRTRLANEVTSQIPSNAEGGQMGRRKGYLGARRSASRGRGHLLNFQHLHKNDQKWKHQSLTNVSGGANEEWGGNIDQQQAFLARMRADLANAGSLNTPSAPQGPYRGFMAKKKYKFLVACLASQKK